MVTIPDWDNNKVLPPIHPNTPAGEEHDSLYRSPYVAPLVEFITRFATTPQRVALAGKFLEYRAALHQWEISEGFQWINGSFVENVEQRSPSHTPRDIDVVTFFHGSETATLAQQLFDPETTTSNFNVDAYGIELGGRLDVGTAVLIGHLHSLWSHRRDHIWKGFLQVDLDPEQDPPALCRLQVIKQDLKKL